MPELNDDTHNITLYDEAGNQVNVILSNGIYRLAVDAKVTGRENIRPGTFLGELAVDSGSSDDLNVDGSVTPVVFNVVANTGKRFFIHRLILVMEDQNINFQKFGGIAGGITNGLDIEVKEGGQPIRSLGGPIKLNAQFAFAGSGIAITASATDLMQVTFDVAARGTTLELVDSDSDFFRITVNDDLTPIDVFKVVAQGFEVSE